MEPYCLGKNYLKPFLLSTVGQHLTRSDMTVSKRGGVTVLTVCIENVSVGVGPDLICLVWLGGLLLVVG